jgi:hypothetical protein
MASGGSGNRAGMAGKVKIDSTGAAKTGTISASIDREELS